MLLHSFVLVMRLMTDRKGVTAMEYGVLTAAIILAVATILGSLGTTLSTTFTRMAHTL
jgi:pilus assembly protein Flp/PilA